jgi:DNA replication protein DnaC
MQNLKDLLPKYLGPEANLPASDILTDEEKQSLIDYEVRRAREWYIYRMVNRGIHFQDAELRSRELREEDLIDRDRILAEANQRKHWRLQDEEEQKRKKEEAVRAREELARMATAGWFYNVMKHEYGQGFEYRPPFQNYIRQLCLFFARDAAFEGVHTRGLFVMGTPGLGKTKNLAALRNNPFRPFRVISIVQIAEAVRRQGSFELEPNSHVLIDDVGTEVEMVNHYGTKINWFKDFIELAYSTWTDFSGLYITTNLGGEELEARYGYRVRSRIREMFNIIKLEGEDQRK